MPWKVNTVFGGAVTLGNGSKSGPCSCWNCLSCPSAIPSRSSSFAMRSRSDWNSRLVMCLLAFLPRFFALRQDTLDLILDQIKTCRFYEEAINGKTGLHTIITHTNQRRIRTLDECVTVLCFHLGQNKAVSFDDVLQRALKSGTPLSIRSFDLFKLLIAHGLRDLLAHIRLALLRVRWPTPLEWVMAG